MSFAIMNANANDVLFQEDILFASSSDLIHMPELEQQIKNYIQAGETEKLRDQISSLLNEYTQESLSFHTVKGLACGILCIIIRVLDTLSFKEFQEEKITCYHILSSIVQENSYDKMKALLLDAAARACRISNSLQASAKNNNLVEKIEGELSKHLYNENLNIMFLSEQIGLNAKYLSSSYLEATGSNLIDVIHKRRIERFKELVSKENYSIKEAAAAVGYTSLVTLNRWFKKFEGITPGKLKDTRHNVNP